MRTFVRWLWGPSVKALGTVRVWERERYPELAPARRPVGFVDTFRWITNYREMARVPRSRLGGGK